MQDVLSWSHLPSVVAVGAVLLMLLMKFPRSAISEVRLKLLSGWAPNALPLRRSPTFPARFERMDEAEFESEVGKLLRDLGYSVRPTPPASIHDADLLLEMASRRVAVQLRRWNAPVGDRSVYAAFVGRIHYGTDEAWLITTSRFTPKAIELARTTGVRLVDGTELAQWLEFGAKKAVIPAVSRLESNLVETPSIRKPTNPGTSGGS